MNASCEATLDNIIEREKLCKKIRDYGVEPLVVENMVYVEFEGDKPTTEKFIQLFEPYPRHSICVIEP